MMIREARLDELRKEVELYETTLPFWAIEAYKAAERAFRLVESEEANKDPKAKDAPNISIDQDGDSDVWSNVKKAKDDKKRLENMGDFESTISQLENEELTDEISDYFRDINL